MQAIALGALLSRCATLTLYGGESGEVILKYAAMKGWLGAELRSGLAALTCTAEVWASHYS